MPGSVRRSDSTRSDSSTDSRKKVSFNRAVKVKKYSRPLKHSQQGTNEVSPEKRFWFKVYKNRHNEEPDLVKESREYNGDINYRSQDLLHPSQMPVESPYVRKDHVKQIVNQFNQDSVIKPTPDRQVNGHTRPMDPPADYGGSIRYSTNGRHKQKKNPLVNGVKVMFGMNSLKKKSKDQVQRKNMINSKKYQGTNTRNGYSEDEERGPHRTNIVIPDNKKSLERSLSHSNSRVSSINGSNASSKRNDYSRSPPYSNGTTESWDSGNRLVLDVNQLDTSVDDTLDGKFSKTLEQNHRMWTREKTSRYEEPLFALDEGNKSFSNNHLERQPPPRTRRKGKIPSTDETKVTSTSPVAFKKKSRKEDKAIQCDEFWDESEESWDSEQLSELENCRIIKSKNGFVSAFSDVPTLEKKTDVVYSQVDKSKKKKRPPIAVPVDISLEDAKAKEDSYYKHTNVKTTTKSFGMKLKNGFQENVYDIPVEKDWYDVDGELEDAKWSQRVENGEESSEAETAPSSVIREVDYKKREISYENVPRKETVKNGQITSDRLWFHKVDDDYRREMLQNEPSSDLSYSSLGRRGKMTRNDVSMGQSHTLDRHRTKNQPQLSNVRILVNGKEVNEPSENKCIRGGLAASYQTRQRALQRSNSTAARILTRTPNNRLSPSRGGSSAASGISSSDSETSRRRKPVVLYIPGVSHPDRTIEEDDRSSGINVARTQSMLSSSKPTKYRSRVKASRPSSSDKSDLSRSNSMPKNVKFPWFKWKVRAKPSREP